MRARITATIAALILGSLPLIFSNSAFAAVAPGVGISQNNLVFDFDAANPNGGSGTALTNLVTSNSAVAGTLQSGVTRSSLNGGKFVFDGTANSYATVSIGATNFTSGFSLSFYAKFSSGVANDRTFERIIDFANAAATTGDANSSMWVGRYVDTNDLALEVWNGTTRPGTCRAIGAIKPNIFTHYAVTVDGNTCTFYVDKVAQTTTYLTAALAVTTAAGAGGINPPAVTRSSAFIGKSNWADDFFKGEIGEIAMYNGVLNQSEINQNFDAQTDISSPTLSTVTLNTPENNVNVDTLTASESAIFSITSGGDSALFNMTNSGAITFKTAPNYELPTDSNSDNVYLLSIQVLDLNGNLAAGTITITVTNVAEVATLTFYSLSASPLKGVPVTIAVTPSAGGTAGKVSYLVNGKRIPKCYKIIFSGSGNSTCSWKPAVRGSQELTIAFTPNGSEYAASSIKKSFFVNQRLTNR